MTPQVAVGGRIPTPMKESVPSASIALGMPNATATTTGPRAFGSRWRDMMRVAGAPMALAASTYSFSLRDRTWPRTRRAIPTQLTMAIPANMSTRPPIRSPMGWVRRVAKMMMRKSRSGKA